MIRAHQPGSQPIDIPEMIPNPAAVPKREPAPKEPAPKEPVKVPEKVGNERQQRGDEATLGEIPPASSVGPNTHLAARMTGSLPIY